MIRVYCPACREVFESDQTTKVAVFDHEADQHRAVMGQGTILFVDLDHYRRLLANA